MSCSVSRTIRIALAAAFAALVLAAPAQAQTSPDVTVFGPSLFSTASPDEQVRFAWFPDNGQDFFRVVFSQTRSFGWESSPYGTRETVLNSTYTSPQEIGLTSGTWYWRVCYGWNDDPSHTCYLDDDIRTLDVEERALPVSMATAVSTTKQAVRLRYHVRSRVRCARIDLSDVLCRADFRRHGRARTRLVKVWSDATGIYYYFRK